MQLEIERQALQKEKDQASRDRLEKLEKDLADLREKSSALNLRWNIEKDAISNLRTLKAQLEETEQEIEQAERDANLEKAARLRYETLRQLKEKIQTAEAKLKELQQNGALLKEEVDSEEIAEIVAKWTGIPVNRLLEGEMEKLLRMEDRLHQRVVGQDEAVTAVSNAVRRSRSGMQDPNRPIGSFISSDLRVWVKPSLPVLWRNSFLTIRTRLCGWT
jgi:ATP-dependent Clp protease ATP-binding subunit ClpB